MTLALIKVDFMNEDGKGVSLIDSAFTVMEKTEQPQGAFKGISIQGGALGYYGGASCQKAHLAPDISFQEYSHALTSAIYNNSNRPVVEVNLINIQQKKAAPKIAG